MEFIWLVCLGVGVGFISAFFGVGGGIVMVPILNIFYPHFDQHFIIATSLSVIFINSIINTYNFKKSISVKWKTVLYIALSSVISAFLTAEFAKSIDSRILKWIFVFFITLVAGLLLFRSTPNTEQKPYKSQVLFYFYHILIGVLTGFISAITGLGGGAIIVPLMIYLLFIPMNQVSAYSNAIMIFTTLSGTLAYMMSKTPEINYTTFGFVIPILTLTITFGSFFGSKFGVKLNQKVDQKIIKKSFAALLLLAAMKTVNGLL